MSRGYSIECPLLSLAALGFSPTEISMVKPPDTAAALEQIHLEGPLPPVLGHTPEGLPRYAADPVASYLGVTVVEVIQALESVPAEERPLELG